MATNVFISLNKIIEVILGINTMEKLLFNFVLLLLLKIILVCTNVPYGAKSFADVSIHHCQSGNFLNIQLKIDIGMMDSFQLVCGIKAAARSKPDLEGIESKL